MVYLLSFFLLFVSLALISLVYIYDPTTLKHSIGYETVIDIIQIKQPHNFQTLIAESMLYVKCLPKLQLKNKHLFFIG